MRKLKTTFSERVLECALVIPFGKVTTYGRIAKASGGGGLASRSVTGILGRVRTEDALHIPFHRIVYADGTVFIADEYKEKRGKLYKKEGIELTQNGKIKDFHEKLFEFI